VHAIKLSGTYAIELPHPRLQIRVRCFNQKVIMIAHQAVSMTKPKKFFYAACQQIEKQLLIHIIKINRRPRITA
jgi:hypothetical protein